MRGVRTVPHSAPDRTATEWRLIRNPAESCVVLKVQHQEMKTPRSEDLKAYPDAAERRNTLATLVLQNGLEGSVEHVRSSILLKLLFGINHQEQKASS